MPVTDEEAYLLWCPMARVEDAGVVVNRIDYGQMTKCLGSSCAMWRYSDPDTVEDRRGYCGIGGRHDWE